MQEYKTGFMNNYHKNGEEKTDKEKDREVNFFAILIVFGIFATFGAVITIALFI